MNVLVSIITPSFNSDRFLEDCINSVINQSFKEWEMLIVDDCSSDKSTLKIKDFAAKDHRIKPFLLTKNVGAAAARNVAINNSKGKYIAFLDSDDIWYPKKLEKQIQFMQENDIAFSFCSYESISEDGTKLYNRIRAPKKITYSSYLKNTIIGCLTVVIDKNKVGPFNMPIIRSSHDMALWLSILKRGFVAYGMEECLAKYRVVSKSNSSKKLKAAKDVWKVYRKIENINYFKSIYYFSCYAFNALKKRIF